MAVAAAAAVWVGGVYSSDFMAPSFLPFVMHAAFLQFFAVVVQAPLLSLGTFANFIMRL